MADDIFDIDIVVTRKPYAPPPPLFKCLICETDVPDPRLPYRLHGRVVEQPPVCKSCAHRWGRKASGPVFNRRNHHTLAQLAAIINCLTWEVRNGDRRYRR